jgi:hypothetical protein
LTLTDAELVAAHEHCFENVREIQASQRCVCYFCAANELPNAYFAPGQIVEWLNPINNGEQPGPMPLSDKATAFCPNCTFDMVIGDASGLPIHDAQFVAAIHERF